MELYGLSIKNIKLLELQAYFLHIFLKCFDGTFADTMNHFKGNDTKA